MSTNHEGGWLGYFEMFGHFPEPGKLEAHFSVKIEIASPRNGVTCDGFSYDDGFFSDESLVHGKPCKINPKWPGKDDRYKPAPPGISPDPADWGKPPVIQVF